LLLRPFRERPRDGGPIGELVLDLEHPAVGEEKIDPVLEERPPREQTDACHPNGLVEHEVDALADSVPLGAPGGVSVLVIEVVDIEVERGRTVASFREPEIGEIGTLPPRPAPTRTFSGLTSRWTNPAS
jgi:hypothetical protein